MPKAIVFDKYQKRSADYHWQQISRSLFHFNAYVVARYQQVIDRIPAKKNFKILDIGCGDGVLSYLVWQKTKAQIYGLDSDRQSLAIGRQKLFQGKFVAGSAYRLPFKNRFFDVVIAAEVIEHLSSPEKMLAEIRRVLKPKAKAIITTPIKIKPQPEDKLHVQEYSPAKLQALLQAYFKSIKITTSHPYWLKRLYTQTICQLGRYHFDLFRWLINLLVLITGYNPFSHWPGKPSQQTAVGYL